VAVILREIDKGTFKNLTLKTFSRKLQLSERRLGALFRSDTGKAFRPFIREARMAKAQALLADPGMSVKQVAATLGYSATSNSDRDFRLAFAITPHAFRQQLLISSERHE
jgi:AraC-like DNA-binding protein